VSICAWSSRLGGSGLRRDYAWYHPGRDHILFTIEDEIHHGSMLAWRLPKLPPALREALGYESFLTPAVMILPPELMESS
jgi:hypothetical protein